MNRAFWSGKKVLITGGSGFIGSHVVAQLLDDGYTPVIYDRHIKTPPPGCELILGDVRDPVAVTEAVAHESEIAGKRKLEATTEGHAAQRGDCWLGK